LAGTLLHPMHADPHVASAAFAEYAADRHWIASHLLQLAGALAMLAALVLLGRLLAGGAGRTAAVLGSAGAIASMATAAALQAVDGVALKSMVEAWSAAAEADKAGLFHAAFAVRQIETGLAAVASLLFGLTVVLFGIALWREQRFPKWLAAAALAGGAGTGAAGIVMAYTGFSELAMTINMPANIVLLFWMIALGIAVWNKPAEGTAA
jgi:hypothetical protein